MMASASLNPAVYFAGRRRVIGSSRETFPSSTSCSTTAGNGRLEDAPGPEPVVRPHRGSPVRTSSTPPARLQTWSPALDPQQHPARARISTRSRRERAVEQPVGDRTVVAGGAAVWTFRELRRRGQRGGRRQCRHQRRRAQ